MMYSLELTVHMYLRRFLGDFQPQPGKPDAWELDSDQHYNVGRYGQSNINEHGRLLLFKRSWSDGNILRESYSPSPTSNSNVNVGFSSAELSDNPRRESKMLSESTPEISASESDVTFSRFTASAPSAELCAEIQRDGCLEHENGDKIDCSNFVDLDWLSSGTSEESLERSMLSTSPFVILSSENVISEMVGETTPSASECGSSNRGRQLTETSSSYISAHNYEVLEEFSDSFAQWITHGEAICL